MLTAKDMKKQKIKISIIVPTLNRGDSLTCFLKSLQKIGTLNRNDTEVLIVSNNNDKEIIESTKNICDKFGVRFCHESSPGKPYALNTGIIASSGQFLVFTDDDVEIYDPLWFDKMVSEFSKNKKLGYVSGNVIAYDKNTDVVKMWEKKGGLSKGLEKKYWSRSFLNSTIYKVKPWQFNKICAGANCVIPKSVLEEIGGYNILLESGIVGHGATLEIGYKIARSGYELLYTPESEVYHKHPKTQEGLLRKMYIYGIGDTAYHMSIFLEFLDFRSLWWSLVGHSLYTIKNKLIPSLFGKYPFPSRFVLAGLKGNIAGPILFIYSYVFLGGLKEKSEYYKFTRFNKK